MNAELETQLQNALTQEPRSTPLKLPASLSDGESGRLMQRTQSQNAAKKLIADDDRDRRNGTTASRESGNHLAIGERVRRQSNRHLMAR